MTPEEAYSIKVISDVKLSTRGLIHGETWIESKEYRNSVFLNGRRVTWGGKEILPNVINDTLYFVRTGEKHQLVAQQEFGEPKTLLELGKILKYDVHEKGILVLGEEVSDKSSPLETSRIKHKFDGRGLLRSRTSLFLLQEGKLRTVVEGDFDVMDFATNGSRVIVVTSQRDDEVGLSSLQEVDVETGERRDLISGDYVITSVAVNDKGGVAFLGHGKGKSPWAVKEVHILEEGRSFLCGKTCGSSVISDLFDGAKERLVYVGDSVISLGQEGGETNLYRIEDGKVTKITHGEHVIRLFDYDGRRLAYVKTTPERPSLLVSGDLTYDPNPQVTGVRPLKVDSRIEGWAILTDRSAPTILFVHGGPHMAYGYSYYIEFQFFVKNGFNVLYSNPRGSQGYGEEFAKACVGDWGGGDMEDILTFVKDAKEQLGLEGKLGVTGGSYGGFMTNWIITHSDVFSAAVSERGISNLVSMCGTSDIGFWFNAVESGIEDPWKIENMEKLMRMSPIYYVERAKTPTMLIHGEEDYRCPMEQAEQFFTALKMRGIETRLVRYQGDGHEHARKGKPENMVHRLSVKLEWFRRHLTS